ncbi:MAG: aromatic ring-hydroxylating dioxygenase subunit alpha [Rhodospirillaceae bacterium]|nr:MAG: aromatic ring-hydroxylating dioxygenase subunit alpha [Rhodospirillaceae bacterium]
MGTPKRHSLTLDGRDVSLLRGDPITGDRYYSKEFAQREWDHMWTRVWHIAGRVNELVAPGDYIVHNFMHESVIVVRQDDGTLKGFYNVCRHRGLRLVQNSAFVKDGFHCPYHGWHWGKDGVLIRVQDSDDYPQGNPCGKIKLKEVQVDTWGGFVWYTMSDKAESLSKFLEPIPEIYRNYPLETLVRVAWYKIELNTNWKFSIDNFSESYHTRTLHPQVPPWIDQDVSSARHEMFPRGHGRTVQPMRPSLTDRLPDGVPHPYDDILRMWGINPDSYPDFATKAMQGWLDLKAQKRKLWKERGYLHYEHMNDEELTDSPHTVLFPNCTISFLPDNIIFFRTEPHPNDPNKCTFDLWCMAFPVKGQTEVESIMAGRQPLREAEMEYRVFDWGKGVPELADQIVFQDMMVAEAQQQGLHSRGFTDAYLSGQETRVRFFHEVLNDWLEGRR